MRRPDWWLLLEYIAVFIALIALGNLTQPGCYPISHLPPTFSDQIDRNPAAFYVLVVSFGFVAYSTLKLNGQRLLRRKP